MRFMVLPYIRCKTPFQNQSVFRLLDWILCYTLFHGFDTLGSHLRKEGSFDYDGGLVRLQVQTNFDTIINRQQRRSRTSIMQPLSFSVVGNCGNDATTSSSVKRRSPCATFSGYAKKTPNSGATEYRSPTGASPTYGVLCSPAQCNQ
jgi:hypothetical protein